MSALFHFPCVAVISGPSLAIPAPYWLLTVLHWLTFVLHLLAMNFLFGTLLTLLIGRKGIARELLFDTFTKIFPSVMAATITLGVAPLLFTQVVYGEYFYGASIVSAWNWFLIMPVALVTYYVLYIVALKKSISGGIKTALLLCAAIGFIYISYTLTMISDLAEKPHLWGALYHAAPSGTSINPSHWQTLFRWAHSITGAVAVAGIIIQWFALFHSDVSGNKKLLAYGARVYILAAIKGSVLAVIYLFTLDSDILKRFLSSPGLHAISAAIVVNAAAVVLTLKGKKSEKPRSFVLLASGLVFLGVACMVIGRHFLRLVYLQGQFDPAKLNVNPQWSVFALFFITFLAGLGVLYWMLKKFFWSRPAVEQPG